MTPEDYLYSFVIPNLTDFKEDHSNIRKAFNAAVSASHLADCYYNFNERNNPELVAGYKDFGDFLGAISKKTDGYFADIRSISNAYKHLYTGLKEWHAARSTISSIGTIEVIEFTGIDIKEISEDYEDNGKRESTVVYTKKTGQQIRFLKAINVVEEYWMTFI